MCSAETERKCVVWSPWELLQGGLATGNHAIVILNQNIRFNKCPEVSIIANLWNSAKVRITVDGGTDRWLKWTEANSLSHLKDPDLITGDMDSIKPETLNFFRTESTSRVVFTTDQDETDFTKSLKQLSLYLQAENIEIDSVLVICETTGRFDHLISNVNTLFKATDILPINVKVFILSSINLTWLLMGNNASNKIVVPHRLVSEKKACGMLPFGKPCLVSTSGLKWNLENGLMEFGSLISTSNTYSENIVSVETDNPLVWTMEIENLLPTFQKL